MLVWAWSGDVSAVSADLPSWLWNALALARAETNIFHHDHGLRPNQNGVDEAVEEEPGAFEHVGV